MLLTIGPALCSLKGFNYYFIAITSHFRLKTNKHVSTQAVEDTPTPLSRISSGGMARCSERLQACEHLDVCSLQVQLCLDSDLGFFFTVHIYLFLIATLNE